MFSLDFLGSAFAIASTLAFAFAWTIAWPLGLVAILCDLILFFKLQIYGDAILQLGYLAMGLYGWLVWWRASEPSHELPITWLTLRERIYLLGFLLLTIPICAYFLAHTLHSRVPVLDATTTLLSITAQGLMCRKKLDSWPLWWTCDVIYLMLFYTKGSLPYHMFVLPVYVCIGIIGFYRWQQLMVPANRLINATPTLPILQNQEQH